MLEVAFWLLQWARTYGNRFFLRFGLHCATHQIRVILICGVVITSLFYPALSLYTSTQPTSLSILDAFTIPFAVRGVHAHQDLVDLWSGYDSLHVRDDAVSRARCGLGRILRVERVLIQRPPAEDDGALNHQILLFTLNLEAKLDSLISSKRISCLRRPDGRCLVLSPLAFWNYDKDALMSDTNILDTLNLRNVSTAGLPVTPHMVLAGRESSEHHVGAASFDFARFLALTYFFPVSDCVTTSERVAWLQVLESATNQNVELFHHEPTLIALEYDSTPSKWSAISTFVYLAYAGFFAYVFWTMRTMTAVHSKVGLTFTALVEIAVSTITSLSVCALVGFKVTMVPWELLPIVIAFVGAENMFNLVDAVGRTSVTLPVKQRIAEGMSRAGTSNTLKVVSYNAILGVIAFFSFGAIRQFCVFAIVVLVAHWFLAHTFFITVLSVDIQRLELEELLRQNSSLAPNVPSIAPESALRKSNSKWQGMMSSARGLLRGRAKKNLSLFMLLAITATLYYVTSLSPQSKGDSGITTPRGAPRNAAASMATVNHTHDPAAQIWKILNPQEATLHIRFEMPTIVTLRPDLDSSDHQKPHRPRFSMRTFRLVSWFVKIMVMPIAATMLALWGLLLYLLKDTELLEAQRNRPEPDASSAREEKTTLERKIAFSTLPRAFDSDVELIAMSDDGQVVVSVGLQNEVVIWRIDSRIHTSIDATDVLLSAASASSATSTLTAVAVDEGGKYCAVGTGAGVTAVWRILQDGVYAFPHIVLGGSSAGVTELQFICSSSKNTARSPPTSRCASPVEPNYLVVSYENGVVAKWTMQEISSVSYITPSRQSPVVKATLLRVVPENRLLVAFCLLDGSLELCDVEDRPSLIPSDLCLPAGNPTDLASKAHVCSATVNGETRVVVVVATEAGVVSLWDGKSGEFIRMLEDAYGSVSQLKLSPIQRDTCHFCGHPPLDSFLLTFSVNHVVWFYMAHFTDETRRCSCTPTQVRRVASWDGSIGRRSRSNSVASSLGSSSPTIGRNKIASGSAMSPFPVSGHGIHSRRASEKDAHRRASETLSIPLPGEDWDGSHAIGPPDIVKSGINSISSHWQRMTILKAGDTTCERGGWGIVDGHVIGVRRRPRPQIKASGITLTAPSSSSLGLSSATLNRWEIWSFDPSTLDMQTSTLSSLTFVEEKEDSPSPSSFSSSSLSSITAHCIPRLPFTRVSPFIISRTRSLAGFGNTLGVFRFLDS